MANVKLIEQPKGLVPRLAVRYGRKRFGRDVEPLQAALHHRGVLIAAGLTETAAEKGWRKLDPHLALLAQQAVAGAIGCSWCIDYGYYESVQHGADPRKVRDVGRWQDSDAYDERERLVLEYTAAVNTTPSSVTDGLATRLRAQFSEKEIVELTAWIALENYRSRFNAGLGLSSEGFSDACAVPLAAPV